MKAAISASLAIVLGIIGPELQATDNLPSSRDRHAGIDFAVTLSEERNDWHYAAGDVPTKTQRISAVYSEPFGDNLRLGLHGGFTYITQSDNPLTAGQELDGYHAGISATLVLVRFATGRVFAAARYTYQEASSETGTQSVELSWAETGLSVGVSVEVGSRVELLLGATYGTADGDEKVRGTLNATTPFERSASGAFAGIGVGDGAGGTVGVRVQTGLDRGTTFYFQRLF